MNKGKQENTMPNFRISKSTLIIGTIILIVALLANTAFCGKKENVSLRFAVLPIPDVLPYHLAREEGYFHEEGVFVEALPVASALDRDQLMQTGQIDAMLTEIVNSANFNRNRLRVKIVCVARSPIDNHSLFSILSAPGSGIETVSDLRRIPIGISKNTIIEYVTDRLLTHRGLTTKDIVETSVPVIPERYQLLLQGQIKAATLPEPLASSAQAAGAVRIVADATVPKYSASVISFSLLALESKTTAVIGFLKAWDRAVTKINAAPDDYRPLLLKKIRVPKNIAETFPIPKFPRNRVPGADQWADVMEWMIHKGLLEKPLPYEESVTSALLPAGKD